MKRAAFLLSILLFACNSPRKDVEQATYAPSPASPEINVAKEVVHSDIQCAMDPTQSYALFLPSQFSDSVRRPVLIFLDPQGDGTVPLEKYRQLAGANGTILIGSNTCKNGMTFEQTTQVITNLAREASVRWNASTVSLAGFSGGAKAALYAAQQIPDLVAAVYCGAAISFEGVTHLPPVLGISGTRDMNYFETWNASDALDKQVLHAFVEWNGKHEWPDASTFEEAFSWCTFMSMRKGILPRDEARIAGYKDRLLSSLQGRTAFGKVSRSNYAIACLGDLTDVSQFREIAEKAARTEEFSAEMRNRKQSYEQENNIRNSYLANMESKNASWWLAEVEKLNSGIGNRDGNQRLLGYVSLASYMYSRDAIAANRFSEAWKYLSVYKIADPENPEQPFLQACYFARQGDKTRALNSLQQAVRLGFKDKERMATEPSFEALRNNELYRNILDQIKS